ncbi:MAG: DUF488 domain-containing protein [Phocaeicola sp.]|uniref:DUF488 domain-containing protein n=1 Tax=Phocaeicola TaxID=909656 RepID=UPI00234EE29A|nr:DUF488 domain-containing protein [Phocaeicola oris]MCE2617366.1 DUF488 domain-containing protein [Phocaeicola oris]
MGELRIKRVYLSADASDGYRILIDRLWPRGISKEKALIDEWRKEVTPTTSLRKWFGHKEENYAEFAQKYRAELDGNQDALQFIAHCRQLLKQGNVTLLYGAKSETCNHALILRDWILNK